MLHNISQPLPHRNWTVTIALELSFTRYVIYERPLKARIKIENETNAWCVIGEICILSKLGCVL